MLSFFNSKPWLICPFLATSPGSDASRSAPGSPPGHLHLAAKLQAPLGSAGAAALSCAGTHAGTLAKSRGATRHYPKGG